MDKNEKLPEFREDSGIRVTLRKPEGIEKDDGELWVVDHNKTRSSSRLEVLVRFVITQFNWVADRLKK